MVTIQANDSAGSHDLLKVNYIEFFKLLTSAAKIEDAKTRMQCTKTA